MRRGLVAMVMVLSTTAAGCSFALVRAPPATVELGVPARCTRSWVWPIVDGSVALVALSMAVTALAGFVPGREGEADEDTLLAVAGGGAALGLGFGISAARGGRRAWRCRATDPR